MTGLLDRCIWQASGAGTGSFVQSAQVVGYQTMQTAGAVDQQTYNYIAQSSDLSQWEFGNGTWTAASSTLARTTIYANSLGGTSAINFTNPPQILITLTAVTARAQSHGVQGGRLTLTSATPVLTANTTAQGTVYYTPYLHNNVTCFDGVGLSNIDFVESSVTLDTTNWLSGSLHDFFIFLNGAAPTLGYGPAWTSTTARSAATALARVQGQWTNNTTITLRTNSTTTFSIATNQAVYVGTGYATANGQTGMNFTPAGAAGGNLTTLGLFNAYNRVPLFARSSDATASWTYNVATWRPTNNSTSNAVRFVDGLGEVSMICIASSGVDYNATTPVSDTIGINLNSTSATPDLKSTAYFKSASENGADSINIQANFLPVLGFNTITAMELGDTATSFFASGASAPFTQHITLNVMI